MRIKVGTREINRIRGDKRQNVGIKGGTRAINRVRGDKRRNVRIKGGMRIKRADLRVYIDGNKGGGDAGLQEEEIRNCRIQLKLFYFTYSLFLR